MEDFLKSMRSQPWRRRVVLRKLAEGAIYREAAASAGVTKQTVFNWRHADPEFERLVSEARRIGAERRTYLVWLRHPFRGCRPPRAAGARGGYPVPRFRVGG